MELQELISKYEKEAEEKTRLRDDTSFGFDFRLKMDQQSKVLYRILRDLNKLDKTLNK